MRNGQANVFLRRRNGRRRLAEGCPGAAVSTSENRLVDDKADRILASVRKPEKRAEMALGQLPWMARGEFTQILDSLARQLRGRMKAQKTDGAALGRLVRALALVQIKREEAQGNANPQLALAVLTSELKRL